MPPLEHMDMTSNVVYWRLVRHDKNGFPLVVEAEEIHGRWEEINKEMVDDKGNRVQVDVILTVPQQLVMGSLMWEGELSDLPSPPRDLYEVVGRDRGKDLKGYVTRYEFGLRRYKDKLPQTV